MNCTTEAKPSKKKTGHGRWMAARTGSPFITGLARDKYSIVQGELVEISGINFGTGSLSDEVYVMVGTEKHSFEIMEWENTKIVAKSVMFNQSTYDLEVYVHVNIDPRLAGKTNTIPITFALEGWCRISV